MRQVFSDLLSEEETQLQRFKIQLFMHEMSETSTGIIIAGFMNLTMPCKYPIPCRKDDTHLFILLTAFMYLQG